MGNKVKKSVAELMALARELAEKNSSISLPTTAAGIQYRADKERWAFEKVPTQGGKNGLKKIYTLPEYVLAELAELNLADAPAGAGMCDKGVDGRAADALNALPLRDSVALRVSGVARDGSDYSGCAGVARDGSKAALRGADALRAPDSSFVGDALPSGMRDWVASYDAWAVKQKADVLPVRLLRERSLGVDGAVWLDRALFVALGVSPDRCFCTRVLGDSMQPTLFERGTVLWLMTGRYTGAGIYLFRQVNEWRVKRLQQINGFSFSVISDNANKDIYPTETLNLRDFEAGEFEILGRYLWDAAVKP